MLFDGVVLCFYSGSIFLSSLRFLGNFMCHQTIGFPMSFLEYCYKYVVSVFHTFSLFNLLNFCIFSMENYLFYCLVFLTLPIVLCFLLFPRLVFFLFVHFNLSLFFLGFCLFLTKWKTLLLSGKFIETIHVYLLPWKTESSIFG